MSNTRNPRAKTGVPGPRSPAFTTAGQPVLGTPEYAPNEPKVSRRWLPIATAMGVVNMVNQQLGPREVGTARPRKSSLPVAWRAARRLRSPSKNLPSTAVQVNRSGPSGVTKSAASAGGGERIDLNEPFTK
jgi:hypothetical protein